jgi:hypothetical protein
LLSALGIPTVIFACKSDLALQVDAATGNALGEPHNVGLIEVTSETSEGRSKMRNGLRWLLHKLEQRQRKFYATRLTAGRRASKLAKEGSDASEGHPDVWQKEAQKGSVDTQLAATDPINPVLESTM